MRGIAEMFAAFDSQDDYESIVFDAGVRMRARAVERTRQWRKDNPVKFRALRRRLRATYQKHHPDQVKAAVTRHREKNREKLRATWRRNSKAYKARKRNEATCHPR